MAAAFCSCRKGESGCMIECDRCGEWFHLKCAGLSKDEADRLHQWHCFVCTRVQRSITSLREEVSKMINDAIGQNRQLNNATEKNILKKTNDANDELREESKNLLEEIMILRTSFEELQKENGHLVVENKNLLEENKELKTNFEELQKKNKHLVVENEKLTRNVEESMTRKRELTTATENLLDKNKTTQTKFEELMRKYENLMNENERVKKEIEELRKKIMIPGTEGKQQPLSSTSIPVKNKLSLSLKGNHQPFRSTSTQAKSKLSLSQKVSITVRLE
ncbi:Multicopy suppressor of chk1 protein 1 [Frankliniella fusca]|uniref:Multicopy suppressor of chk1 protein 1 n=1 Tax=Frankliniella fusca TaxID=407009 RepID=A0AAE1LCD7_9NEOP|nr:Multicopy suppressor of chk1 protein 1 [Frankliniella fusca]